MFIDIDDILVFFLQGSKVFCCFCKFSFCDNMIFLSLVRPLFSAIYNWITILPMANLTDHDWPWPETSQVFVIIVDGCWFDVHHNVHNVIGSQSISPLSHLKITRACRLGFPRKRPLLTENDPITITIFNPQNYIAYFFKKLQHNLPKWCIITKNGGCGGFGEDTAHNNKRTRFSVKTSRWWKRAKYFL